MAWLGVVVFDDAKYYNPEDLARENSNIQYLVDELATHGWIISLSFPIIAPDRTWFPTVSNINNTRQNIIDLYDGFYKPTGSPDIDVNPARKQKFGHVEANQLELSLKSVYDLLQSLVKSYRYCGTFNCGEEALL